jgi:hypothetical protein
MDRELTPRDEHGEHDFESLDAIDVALFNQDLRSLVAGAPTELPRYSFLRGRRERGLTMTLRKDSIIIVEGIHGLNPALVRDLPAHSIYRIYVSAAQLNSTRSRISTSDTRLISVVRDAATRGQRDRQPGADFGRQRSSTSSRSGETAIFDRPGRPRAAGRSLNCCRRWNGIRGTRGSPPPGCALVPAAAAPAPDTDPARVHRRVDPEGLQHLAGGRNPRDVRVRRRDPL